MASKRSDREDDIIAKKAVKAIFSESFNGKKKFKDDISDSDRLRVRIKGKPGTEDQVAIAKDGTTLPDFLNEISSSSMVDISELNSFRSMSSDREVQYRIYDEMALDTIISSALELYADDSTQYNSKGEIIWVESENTDVAAFGNRLIDKLNLNENAWSHIYSLVKYGDLYLETFRDDETDDNPILTTDLPYSDIKVHKERKGTQMEEYIEAVPNPAEIFDLTKRGKTVGFIKTPTDDGDALTPHYGYQMMTEGDETVVLRPDKYVHVSLSSDVNRFPETIKLRYMNDSKDEDVNYNSVDDMNVHTYTVSRGKSILHDVYKSYKELSLMEDSLLLNRVTRSSIIRLLQIEVGDMEKGQVREVLKRYKNLMEQKNYVDKIDGTYTSMASPGPIDNILYIPTKDGKGNVTASNIGGDVDVKSIVDIDYFKNKLYGGLKIPSAFLEGHCIFSQTEFTLLNGQKRTIEYMYLNKDYYIGKGIMSCRTDGTLEPTVIKDVLKTRRNATFVKVNLDNGKYVIVTPDHLMMLRDGTYIEAQYLEPDDSLMPYYDKVIKGRRFVLDNKSGLWNPQYRLVAKHKYGELPKGHQVHHENEIKIDDDFDNLNLLTTAEHAKIYNYNNRTKKAVYQREIDRQNMTPEEYSEKWGRGGRAVKGYKRSEESCKKISEGLKGKKKSKEHIDNYKKSIRYKIDNDIDYKNSLIERGIKGSKANQERARKEKEDAGLFLRRLRCFECGKIHEEYMSDESYEKYLNKELVSYCCRKCSGNGKLNMSLDLYNKCSSMDEYAIMRVERPYSYYSVKKLKYNLSKMDDYDPSNINHKVVSVEWLDIVEDAYDIEVESENHNFAISAGIFIHNSNDGGLSAGTALTKLDSRYARTIKRIQNAYIQGITTLINIYALDRGLSDHVNNFSVKMLSPSTVEDSERDETMDSRMNMISNFMGLVDDESLFSYETRKDVLTYLVSTLLSEPDISEILENDDTAKKSDEDNAVDSEEKGDSGFSDTDFGSDDFGDFSDEDFGDEDLELGEEEENVDLNGEDISPTEDEEFGDFSNEF